MVEILPIRLLGHNLGERHRCLNTLVDKAYHQQVPLQSILELPEVNAIDRVFKIKLASKYRHVDFIVDNLKNKDMLYVSLALRNRWLLEPEYGHIVNPVYLERHLYPEMTITAVTKMKNYLELNLKQPERCQEFYEHNKNDFDVAIKFLWHCSKEFITDEVSKILDRLTPKHLKILCEACPQTAKIYLEGLQNNKVALEKYLYDQDEYFKSMLNVLKLDGNLFLDLIERYFDKSSLDPLSSSATKYIMKNFKNRYLAKPELYAAWLLHVKTLTRYLSTDEIKDIIYKLARAEYLSSSFTYKNAEPFIKCLKAEERSLIKKQIFVDKSFGTMITTWPYPAPASLRFNDESDCADFADIEHDPSEYYVRPRYHFGTKMKITKKCGARYLMCSDMACMPIKSGLDQLFDRYRFANFDKTFFELRKLLLTEGTIEGRRNMILVLVSKAGGIEEKLEKLLNFLVERHSNEPVHLRDAVARSMVKCAFVWRLSAKTWDLFLNWANTSVPEILHSKVLRHLIAGSDLSPADLTAYVLNFCDLTKYSLNSAEKACIVGRLPALLISADAAKELLDIIKAFKLRVNTVPGAENLLISAALKNEDILQEIFKSKIGCKYLLKEYFKLVQSDVAYVNALKHDLSVLEDGESFARLVSNEKPNHDRFLRALALYFSEPNGLAARHRIALVNGINKECRETYARPMAFLYNFGGESFIDYINKTDFKTLSGPEKKFAAALRANSFVMRPLIDMNVVNWHVIGAKFICNNVLLCSDKDLYENIPKCLTWKKTLRVALRLAVRNKSTSDVCAAVIKIRPIVAVKVVLSDIRKRTLDLHIWSQVKPVISNLDLSKNALQYVKKSLGDLDLTTNIEADYWATVFGVFFRASEEEAMPMLCKLENLLTEVDEDLLKEIISKFLRHKLNKDAILTTESNILCLYCRIIAKYLLSSENENIQKIKKETICDPFFDKIESLWQGLEPEDESKITECLNDFLFALKYNKAFFNTKHVSCIPIFERILERLSKVLPRERYFKKYVCIHLIMLYYRSIRQALKQKPEVFENRTFKRKERVKLVGYLFGKYIGIEIQELVQTCFNSIIELYQQGLVMFLSDNFEYNANRSQLVMSVIRSLIEGGVESQLLAQHVFEEEHSGYISEQERNEILEMLKNVNNDEMKFFLYANIYPY